MKALTIEQKNRLLTWEQTLDCMLFKIDTYQRLFERFKIQEKNLDEIWSSEVGAQEFKDLFHSLVCIQESLIVSFYAVVSTGGEGRANNLTNNNDPVLKKIILDCFGEAERKGFNLFRTKVDKIRSSQIAHLSGEFLKVSDRKQGFNQSSISSNHPGLNLYLDKDDMKKLCKYVNILSCKLQKLSS